MTQQTSLSAIFFVFIPVLSEKSQLWGLEHGTNIYDMRYSPVHSYLFDVQSALQRKSDDILCIASHTVRQPHREF